MIQSKTQKRWWEVVLNYILDFLMFIVPILELTNLVTVLPPDWLPWYTVGMVILRRLVRVLQNYLHRIPTEKVE